LFYKAKSFCHEPALSGDKEALKVKEKIPLPLIKKTICYYQNSTILAQI
jgi:hypothetical protein